MKKSEYKKLKKVGKKLHIKPMPKSKKSITSEQNFKLQKVNIAKIMHEYFEQQGEKFHNNCE